MSLSNEWNPVPKPSKKRRISLTQRQMGDISNEVDKQLKERSKGVCEPLNKAKAIQRAHLTGRRQISHKTTVTDLIHICVPCHKWLDETPEGIRAKRFIATAINNILRQYTGSNL